MHYLFLLTFMSTFKRRKWMFQRFPYLKNIYFSKYSFFSPPFSPKNKHLHCFCLQEVCHCLETLGSRGQCFEILQNAIIKNLVSVMLCMMGLKKSHNMDLIDWLCLYVYLVWVAGGAGLHVCCPAEVSSTVAGSQPPAQWHTPPLLGWLLSEHAQSTAAAGAKRPQEVHARIYVCAHDNNVH